MKYLSTYLFDDVVNIIIILILFIYYINIISIKIIIAKITEEITYPSYLSQLATECNRVTTETVEKICFIYVFSKIFNMFIINTIAQQMYSNMNYIVTMNLKTDIFE